MSPLQHQARLPSTRRDGLCFCTGNCTSCFPGKAKGKTLELKIGYLEEQRILTTEGANILHQLRVLGNDAAHEVKPHSEAQLGLAMDVVEHLLQEVYILPFRTKREFKGSV